MVARFEVVLDHEGMFHFQLRAPEGDLLLAGSPDKSKIMVQNAVLNARNSLRDPDRVAVRKAADGSHVAEFRDRNGKALATSAHAATAEELATLLERIRAHGASAPLVDRTKIKPEHTAR